MNLVRLIYSLYGRQTCVILVDQIGYWVRYMKSSTFELGLKEAPYGNNTDENVSGYMTGSVIFLMKSNTEVR